MDKNWFDEFFDKYVISFAAIFFMLFFILALLSLFGDLELSIFSIDVI